jgi:hypothetical protein
MVPALLLAFSQFAPALLKYVGAGESVTKVTEAVSKIAMAVSGAATPEEAIAVFKNNSQAALQFQMRAMASERILDKLYLADRADARHRDIKLAEAGRKNTRADVLAYGAVAALLLLISVLLFREIPQGVGRDMLVMLVGSLVIIVKDVYSFEFGTTRSSKDKDFTIAQMASNPEQKL